MVVFYAGGVAAAAAFTGVKVRHSKFQFKERVFSLLKFTICEWDLGGVITASTRGPVFFVGVGGGSPEPEEVESFHN